MSTSWFDRLIGRPKKSPEAKVPLPPHRPPSTNTVANILDVRLEQAASLKQLRMYDQALRVMNMARGITLESMQADPKDPMAWLNIGRVQLADEQFDEAKKVLKHAAGLAQESGNKQVAGFIDAALFQVLRHQPNASQRTFDLSKPLTEEAYQAYRSQSLGEMFYVCQSCGRLNLMVGEHCAHCRFAPQNLRDIQLSFALSANQFKTATLVQIAQKIQMGQKPHEFINSLDDIMARFDTDQGVLEKIRNNAEDDYLDFKALDRCPACKKTIWVSSADVCPHCQAKLNRTMLLKLAICVDRLLQQFIWNLKRRDTKEYAQLIILLVNLKYQLVRVQQAPTDAQRHSATELLLKTNAFFAGNGGGVVFVHSPTSVVSQVLDPTVHKDIGATMDFIRDEMQHFLRLISDSVSLF